MALARIITRSHQYAQQLALDLLARGYAVEIVSPDAIPSGPADLELRVEADGTEVQGQVTEIREQGKASKSIEYLQRLKPMMADLLRKWPASDKASPGKEVDEKSAEFTFNAEQEYSDDVELPSAEYQPSAKPVHVGEPELAESARLISPTAPQKPSAPALSIFSITGEPIVWAESESERGGRSEVWFWRAAVGFASMALLILVLGMALRRSPAAPVQTASTATTQTVAAKTQAFPMKPQMTPSTASVAPLPVKSETTLSAASVAPLPPKAAVIATSVPAISSAPKAKPSAVVRRAKAGNSEEVDNGDTTVTYFRTKAAEPPKAATSQVSAIKHYSDMD